MATPRRPGERAGLTQERVRSEARSILSEAGGSGLTMRQLAERLGVQPNALYSHTANKQALIEDVLDDVLGDVVEADADRVSPVEGLTAIMRSTFEILVAHRQLVPLYVQNQGARGPNAHRLGDRMTELLTDAGIEGDQAEEALHVLVVYTIGAAAYHVGDTTDADAGRSRGDRPASEPVVDHAFLSGLGWLLAGIGV